MAKYDVQLGDFTIDGARFAIVAARFNAEVTEALLEAAVATLAEHGVADDHVTVVQVPGAFEIPITAKRLAASGRYEAIIALGAIIRGDTPHFDYVAGECARGVARVAIAEDVPVIFGVLTTDSDAQARARAGGELGNKGSEAALAGLEMVSLLRPLDTIAAQFRSAKTWKRVDETLFDTLLTGVPGNVEALDEHLAPILDRPIAQVDPIERAILRMGAFELTRCRDIPWRVVINECVELAREFGAEQSHRYVNGILDNLARRTREDARRTG